VLGLLNQVLTTNAQPSPTSDHPNAAPTSDNNSNAHIHQLRQSTLLRQPSSTRILSHNNSCIQPCNTVKLLADWRGSSVILLRLEPTVPLTGRCILGCHPFQVGKAQLPTTMSKTLVPPDLRIYNLWQSASSSSFSLSIQPTQANNFIHQSLVFFFCS